MLTSFAQHRQATFREHVEDGSKTKDGANHQVRAAENWTKPSTTNKMPTLQVPKGEKKRKYVDESGKTRCLRRKLWTGETSYSHAAQVRVEQCPEEHQPSPIEQLQLDESQMLASGELEALIHAAKPHKAAGIEEVPIDLLKLCSDIVGPYLEHLFNACLRLSFVPDAFKFEKTIVLPKPGKDDYSSPKSWRPIALLPCIGKLLEKAFLNRMMDIHDVHNLVPIDQYGTSGRCTTKAVQSLINQVHTGQRLATGSKDRYSTLMALDICGPYNKVDRRQLVRILQQHKAIPKWMVDFVSSFLSDRQTVLEMPGTKTQPPFFVNGGVPQGSPLSPFLFLLSTSTLFKHMEARRKDAKAVGVDMTMMAYVDDMYLMVTSESRTTNCKWLTTLHKEIMKWAKDNNASFDKYEVMHFRKSSKDKCNEMPDILDLKGKTPQHDSMRILGIWVDPELKWDAHVQHICNKVHNKLGVLHRISGSVWGTPLSQMRHIYVTQVKPTVYPVLPDTLTSWPQIQPLISYGCAVWFIREPRAVKKFLKKHIDTLEKLQRECLVQIAGAFRQSCKMCLLKELNVEPVCINLDRIVQQFFNKASGTLWSEHVLEQRPLPPNRQLEKSAHPYHTLDHKISMFQQDAQARLREQQRDDPKKAKESMALEAEVARMISSFANDECTRQWPEHCAQCGDKSDKPTLWSDWGRGNLKAYDKLNRPQSTFILQCKIGHIGLKKYLHSRRRMDSAICDCGLNEPETAEHLFCRCRFLTEERRMLLKAIGKGGNIVWMDDLMRNRQAIAADWAICWFGLSQFQSQRKKAAQRFLSYSSEWNKREKNKLERMAKGFAVPSNLPDRG